MHENLKELRQRNRLSQNDVAEVIGVAKNTYIGYETGAREPRIKELKSLGRLYRVSLDELCRTNKKEIEEVNFGKNVRTIRIKQKLTQGNLATLCGMKIKTISRIENGEVDPKLSTVLKLIDGLDIDPNEIFSTN